MLVPVSNACNADASYINWVIDEVFFGKKSVMVLCILTVVLTGTKAKLVSDIAVVTGGW